MRDRSTTALAGATALGRAWSDLSDLEVEINAHKPPHFTPVQDGVETPRISLPALPTGNVDSATLNRLRAYLYHEALGEAKHNTWLDEAAQRLDGGRDYREAVRALCNGAGDAILDSKILQERPGAGQIVRSVVREDCREFYDSAPEPSVGALAALVRYAGEGLTTYDEARAKLGEAWSDTLEAARDWLENPPTTQEGLYDEACKLAQRLGYGSEDEPEPQQGAGGGSGGQEDEQGQGAGQEASGRPDGAGAGAGQEERPAQPLPLGDTRTVEDRLAQELQDELKEAAEGAKGIGSGPGTLEDPPSTNGQALPVDGALATSIASKLKASLSGSAPDRVERQRTGSVDSRNLYRSALGGDCFRRILPADKRDVAASLVVDLSGSMGRRDRDALRELVPAWIEAFKRLEISCGVYAYGSGVMPLLRPGESYQAGQVRAAKVLGEDFGGTRTDAALQVALGDLVERPEEHKMIVSLTDGETYPTQLEAAVHYADVQGIPVISLGIAMEHDPSRWKHHGIDEAYVEKHGGVDWPRGGVFGSRGRWIYVEDASAIKTTAGRALQRVLRDAMRSR